MEKEGQNKNKLPVWELLVSRGLADGKKHAQSLVMAGQVVVNDQRIDKPSTLVKESGAIRIKGRPMFVSRAGEKLFQWAEAGGRLELFKGASVLDIGSSTGGFSDVALRYGSTSISCVDVGTNQLAWKLRSDPRVSVYEKTDIQAFDPLDERYSLVLMDVSFQSVARLLPKLPWKSFISECNFVFLVKPQFELSSTKIPSGGVVVDSSLHAEANKIVLEKLSSLPLEVIDLRPSPVLGRTGNQEFFLHCKLNSTA